MAVKILPTPVQGQRYRVKAGDRITVLAPIAGVTPQDITNANPAIWKNVTSLEKLDTIYPGDILNIPIVVKSKRPEVSEIPEFIPFESDYSAVLVMEGYKVPVMRGHFTQIFNSFSDIADVVFAWEQGADPELDDVSRQGSDPQTQLYLGGRLVLNGVAKDITSHGGQQTFKRVKMYAQTAELVTSTLNAPYSKSNIKLETRCKDLAWPFNVDVVVETDAKSSISAVIKEVGGTATQTCFNHLVPLAKEKGVILTNDKWGNLVIAVSKSSGTSIDQIVETSDQRNSEQFIFRVDGNKRFQNYHAIGQTPKSNKNSAFAKDDTVQLPSLHTFQANVNTDGDLKDAVNFKRNSAMAEAFTSDFPMPGWYTKEFDLWPTNELVDVISPTMNLQEGSQLLIRQAKFVIGNRPETILSLIPPWSYTSENVNKRLDKTERTPSLTELVS